SGHCAYNIKSTITERQVRARNSLRNHPHLVEGEEPSTIREALLGPRALHDVDGLVEALAPLLLGHAVARQFCRPVATAHADVETTFGDDVHERHLLGESQRMMEGQDGRRQADAH